MGTVYLVAALFVVPGLLGIFRLLSRPPEVTSQPVPPSLPAERIDATDWGNVADEAERWLRSQSRS